MSTVRLWNVTDVKWILLGWGVDDKMGITELNGKNGSSWFQMQCRVSQTMISILIQSLQKATLPYTWNF